MAGFFGCRSLFLSGAKATKVSASVCIGPSSYSKYDLELQTLMVSSLNDHASCMC